MRKKKYSKDFIKILCDKRIEDPTLPTSTMNQKISNKKSFTLPSEIKIRKRAINKEFDKRLVNILFLIYLKQWKVLKDK